MPAEELVKHVNGSLRGAWSVVQRSLGIIKNDLQILIYPYLAIIFILVTYPVVGHFVFGMWHRVQQPEVVTALSSATPHALLIHLGLVTFSVFYTLFVTSYFTCMISASTWAELEGHHKPMLYGLRVVGRRFWRVSRFSILAVFFFPMGVVAQRHKFRSPRGAYEAISSSLSLSMSQLAPEAVIGKKGVFETVRQSVDTLGQFWKESLVIRIGTFLTIILMGLVSLLPKLVERYWSNDSTVHVFGWIITVMLGASSYVLIRVIGAVFTTTLYHQAKNKK